MGAGNSSNSNRLCEVGNAAGVPTCLVEEPSNLDPTLVSGMERVCITAGASTPEDLVREVIERLREYAPLRISTMDGIVENVSFGLPAELLVGPTGAEEQPRDRPSAPAATDA